MIWSSFQQKLANASTAKQEHDAFEYLVINEGVTSLLAFDRDGMKVTPVMPEWPDAIVHLRIQSNGDEISHTIIDPSNVQVLTAE